MLIIFDLDDTLIDTSGCITPVKLEAALQRLMQAGMQLPDYTSALEQLYRIDRMAPSGRHALAEFIELAQAPNDLLEIALKELYGTSCSDLPIDACVGACSLLADLAAHHHSLALVTVGDPVVQREKMKNAGIDSTLFSKIIVCKEPNKGPHYQGLAAEFGASPSDVIVCGDKVAIDLSPAKALGFKTVHVRWGRGCNHADPRSDVDYAVTELMEIKEIISNLISFSIF